MITKNVLLDITDIKKAKEILDVNARKTPLVKSFYLTSKTGGEIYLKLENMHKVLHYLLIYLKSKVKL